MIAGDFSAQLFEPEPTPNKAPAGVLGRYRPPCRHQLDELAFDKVLALGDLVHADSFRPATGNRHRCTWYAAVHKQWYDFEWMLVPKCHLPRVASMTLRRVTDPLQTQRSAKEYMFRLEQRACGPARPAVTRPHLQVLRNAFLEDFRQTGSQQTLEVCGPVRWSCRKPWLRRDAARLQLTEGSEELNVSLRTGLPPPRQGTHSFHFFSPCAACRIMLHTKPRAKTHLVLWSGASTSPTPVRAQNF